MSYCNDFFKSIKEEITEPFGYSVYLKNGKLLYVDGFKTIALLSKERIELKTKKTQFVVMGENLSLKILDGESMIIGGAITSFATESEKNYD